MKEKLLSFIKANPRTSFSEIENFFEREHVDYQGGFSIEAGGTNIIFWDGWSHEAVELVLSLVHSGEVTFEAATWFEILTFGKTFNLPIAKRPKNGYKEPHWLPVVLSVKGAS